METMLDATTPQEDAPFQVMQVDPGAIVTIHLFRSPTHFVEWARVHLTAFNVADWEDNLFWEDTSDAETGCWSVLKTDEDYVDHRSES